MTITRGLFVRIGLVYWEDFRCPVAKGWIALDARGGFGGKSAYLDSGKGHWPRGGRASGWLLLEGDSVCRGVGGGGNSHETVEGMVPTRATSDRGMQRTYKLRGSEQRFALAALRRLGSLGTMGAWKPRNHER